MQLDPRDPPKPIREPGGEEDEDDLEDEDDDQKFSVGVLGSKGQIALWKYSEDALTALQACLDSDPDFDPYH